MSLDLFKLTGKTAWITGGSKGLGLQMAHALASVGAHVVINSRHGAEAESAAKAIAEKHGVRALGLAADVAQAAEVETVVQRAGAEFGGIDILVNNAVINVRLPSTELPIADWQRVLDINLTGPFLHRARPHRPAACGARSYGVRLIRAKDGRGGRPWRAGRCRLRCGL
jgi:NAD(P)-dependent dehydrogenase (short-subunit alcohol dehydrogenase family)